MCTVEVYIHRHVGHFVEISRAHRFFIVEIYSIRIIKNEQHMFYQISFFGFINIKNICLKYKYT